MEPDEQEFYSLLEDEVRHAARSLAFGLSRGDHHFAEDAEQECCLAILRAGARYFIDFARENNIELRGALRGFVNREVRQILSRDLQARSRRPPPGLPAEDLLPQDANRPGTLAPEQSLRKQRLLEAMSELIQRLADLEDQREGPGRGLQLLQLHRDGATYQQIADRTGISLNTVWRRVRKASDLVRDQAVREGIDPSVLDL